MWSTGNPVTSAVLRSADRVCVCTFIRGWFHPGKNAVSEDQTHDSIETTDNQPIRDELCDIDAIESEPLRKVARRWRDAGLEIEAGNTLAGDYVHHRRSGAKVYVSHGQYLVRGPGGESQFDNARDAAQLAFGITEVAKQVAGDDA